MAFIFRQLRIDKSSHGQSYPFLSLVKKAARTNKKAINAFLWINISIKLPSFFCKTWKWKKSKKNVKYLPMLTAAAVTVADETLLGHTLVWSWTAHAAGNFASLNRRAVDTVTICLSTTPAVYIKSKRLERLTADSWSLVNLISIEVSVSVRIRSL